MVTQNDAILLEETVLRRVPINPKYYDSTLSHPISRLAFRPTENDIDGISLFRQLFTTPDEIISKNVKPCVVSVLFVKEIIQIGLSVVQDPQDDQLPGHSLIPAIHHTTTKDKKNRMKEYQRELAKLANKTRVFDAQST